MIKTELGCNQLIMLTLSINHFSCTKFYRFGLVRVYSVFHDSSLIEVSFSNKRRKSYVESKNTTAYETKKVTQNMAEDPASCPKRDRSTYRQLIRYYYHVKNTDPQSSILQYCQQIKEDLMVIWKSVNPAIIVNIYIVNRNKDKRFAAVGERYQSKTQ